MKFFLVYVFGILVINHDHGILFRFAKLLRITPKPEISWLSQDISQNPNPKAKFRSENFPKLEGKKCQFKRVNLNVNLI